METCEVLNVCGLCLPSILFLLLQQITLIFPGQSPWLCVQPVWLEEVTPLPRLWVCDISLAKSGSQGAVYGGALVSLKLLQRHFFFLWVCGAGTAGYSLCYDLGEAFLRLKSAQEIRAGAGGNEMGSEGETLTPQATYGAGCCST